MSEQNASEQDSNWEQRVSVWRRRSPNFTIEVKHHYALDWRRPRGWDDGPHRWAVYAYLYPSHPLFSRIEGNSIYQKAFEDIPLHEGCTFLVRHCDEDGRVRSIQFGADYNHLYDGIYRRLAPENFEGCSVRFDANELWSVLQQMQETSNERFRNNNEGE